MNRTILIAALALLATAAPAFAEEDDATRQARWQELRHTLFGDRAVEDGVGVVSLDAPMRALDAAIVPVTIELASPAKVKTLYLTIDDNPSPLAATFHLGPGADAHELRTRVRVESYTLLHAVAETEDGHLYAVEHFVKAAGGCSAPAGKDQAAALERLGQMKLKHAEGDRLQLLISHPNYNGMQMDQVTRNYTPARFIQDIKVMRGDTLIFDLESDISLSEDPAITFGVTDKSKAPVTVELHDSTKAVFRQSFDIPANDS
jgi:sulfur-oxidizing protein SoxY